MSTLSFKSVESKNRTIFVGACRRLHPWYHKEITIYRNIDEKTLDHLFTLKREIEGRNDYFTEEIRIDPMCPIRRAVDLIIIAADKLSQSKL